MSQTAPTTPIITTTSLATSSAASAPSSDTPAALQSKRDRDENFFARWICGEPGYDMKWLSHEENEDLRRAERAKLSGKELEELGFEEPY